MSATANDDKWIQCESKTCDALANVRVMWPGEPPVAMCAECATKARNVGSAMGCYIHVEPIDFSKVAP